MPTPEESCMTTTKLLLGQKGMYQGDCKAAYHSVNGVIELIECETTCWTLGAVFPSAMGIFNEVQFHHRFWIPDDFINGS
jgi:hypothetical protein